MYNFSIYVDDGITVDFKEKIDFCGRLMLNNMEISDNFDGKSITVLNGIDIECYRNLLIENNKKIVLLTIDRHEVELDYFKKVFRNAHLLNIENIRISVDGYEAAEYLKQVCNIGKAYGIGVLLENDSNSYLSTDKILSDTYIKIRNEFSGLIFNPLEFARLKTHPFFHVFYNSRLKNDIRFLRVNDGLFFDGSPAFPGEGNAEIKEMASILLARSFQGYFSFVPYFEDTDMDKYIKIIKAFKKLLFEM